MKLIFGIEFLGTSNMNRLSWEKILSVQNPIRTTSTFPVQVGFLFLEMLPNSMSFLFREEEAELAWSNKKVKDVSHASFREGTDLDPTCKDQA